MPTYKTPFALRAAANFGIGARASPETQRTSASTNINIGAPVSIDTQHMGATNDIINAVVTPRTASVGLPTCDSNGNLEDMGTSNALTGLSAPHRSDANNHSVTTPVPSGAAGAGKLLFKARTADTGAGEKFEDRTADTSPLFKARTASNRRANKAVAIVINMTANGHEVRVLLGQKRSSWAERRFLIALMKLNEVEASNAAIHVCQLERDRLLELAGKLAADPDALRTRLEEMIKQEKTGLWQGFDQQASNDMLLRWARPDGTLAKEKVAYIYFEFPGGNVDYGATEEQTAVKEALQECKAQVQPLSNRPAIRYTYATGSNTVSVDAFICEPTSLEIGDGDELHNVGWFTLLQALELMRDPENTDYPKLLRKVFCQLFPRRLKQLHTCTDRTTAERELFEEAYYLLLTPKQRGAVYKHARHSEEWKHTVRALVAANGRADFRTTAFETDPADVDRSIDALRATLQAFTKPEGVAAAAAGW